MLWAYNQNLDSTWLRDESLETLTTFRSPNVLAREIVEELTAALAKFEVLASALEQQLEARASDQLGNSPGP